MAAIALVLYAVDDAHWMPAAWLANRHALMATTFVLAGLEAHLRWRDGWRPGLALSLLAYALGLTASEAALQALAYLFVLELGLRNGRLLRLLPAATLIAIYAALRKPLGAAVAGSGQYFDPATQPLAYLKALPPRLAMLLGDLLGGVPSDLWFSMPIAQTLLVAVGAGATVVFVWLARRGLRNLPPDQARVVLALAAGAFVALLPGAAGIPGTRLVFASSFGAMALVATLLVTLTTRARMWLLFVHLFAAPLMLLVDQTAAAAGGRRLEAVVRASDLSGDVVVVGTPDAFLAIYPSYIEEAFGPRYRSYRFLTMSAHDLVLSRPAERELRLSNPDGPLLDGPLERLVNDKPLRPGDVIRQKSVEARIESESTVHFTFDDLEGLNFVSWHDGAMRHLPLPPVGGQVTIHREPGMMGL